MKYEIPEMKIVMNQDILTVSDGEENTESGWSGLDFSANLVDVANDLAER